MKTYEVTLIMLRENEEKLMAFIDSLLSFDSNIVASFREVEVKNGEFVTVPR